MQNIPVYYYHNLIIIEVKTKNYNFVNVKDHIGKFVEKGF